MEQVAGIEPAFQPWQGRGLTVIRYLHGALPIELEEHMMESAGIEPTLYWRYHFQTFSKFNPILVDLRGVEPLSETNTKYICLRC